MPSIRPQHFLVSTSKWCWIKKCTQLPFSLFGLVCVLCNCKHWLIRDISFSLNAVWTPLLPSSTNLNAVDVVDVVVVIMIWFVFSYSSTVWRYNLLTGLHDYAARIFRWCTLDILTFFIIFIARFIRIRLFLHDFNQYCFMGVVALCYNILLWCLAFFFGECHISTKACLALSKLYSNGLLQTTLHTLTLRYSHKDLLQSGLRRISCISVSSPLT